MTASGLYFACGSQSASSVILLPRHRPLELLSPLPTAQAQGPCEWEAGRVRCVRSDQDAAHAGGEGSAGVLGARDTAQRLPGASAHCAWPLGPLPFRGHIRGCWGVMGRYPCWDIGTAAAAHRHGARSLGPQVMLGHPARCAAGKEGDSGHLSTASLASAPGGRLSAQLSSAAVLGTRVPGGQPVSGSGPCVQCGTIPRPGTGPARAVR